MDLGIKSPFGLPAPAPAPDPNQAKYYPAAQGVTPPLKLPNVYWIGNNGNTYVKTATGVQDYGKLPAGSKIFDAQLIDNPTGVNPPQTDLTTNNNTSTAPTYTDTTALRDATNVSLGSTQTVFDNAVNGAQGDWQSVTDTYNVEDAANLANYQGDVETNEITRDNNTQASLLSAAKGSRGLNATLASLGALNGTGRTLANRAIATEANADLGAGEKSFKTNAETLFDARGEMEKKEKQRRLDADKVLKDSKQNAKNEYLTSNQKLSNDMAGYWRQAGNFGEADNWTRKASGYTPEIAATTKVNPSQYATTPLEYGAPALNKYLGGMNSTAVNVAGGNPINGSIYTSTKKRDEL